MRLSAESRYQYDVAAVGRPPHFRRGYEGRNDFDLPAALEICGSLPRAATITPSTARASAGGC